MTVLNSISKTAKSLPFGKYPREFIFYTLPEETTPLFYGIELETSSSVFSYEERISGSESIPFLKSDFIFSSYEGSVNPCLGVEFKNHPATFNFLKKNKIQWQRILRQRTLAVNETCGMHIHLSLAAFDDELLFRFIKFIYDNQEFTFTISERNRERFNAWCSLREVFNDEICQGLVRNIRSSCYFGRKAVAITGNLNGETVELRIFSATLSPQHFWKNLEFCDCVYYFCKYVNSSKDITVNNFINYLTFRKLKYKNLYNFLIKEAAIVCV